MSQQQVLLKSKILTPEPMIQVDKEAKRQKSKSEKNQDSTKRNILPRVKDYEEDSSSSYMPMYSLHFGEEGLEFISKLDSH